MNKDQDMTDTTTEITADAQGVPNEAESQFTTEQADAGQHDTQSQTDRDSDEQFQREAEQQEQEGEAERLARLDMETEDDKAGTPLDASVWGSTGHAVADEAMRTLQNCGLSTDDAADLLLDAAIARDPSKVNQKALAAKIGPRRAKAIMEGLEAFARDMRPRDERISNDVYQHTNGAHAYQRLIDKASEKLSAAELRGYISEITKGGPSARRAVETLQTIVSGEATPLDRRVHTEQYAAPKPVAHGRAKSTGITSREYVAALEALHGPGSRLSFEARDRREAELREARRIGRDNGLR